MRCIVCHSELEPDAPHCEEDCQLDGDHDYTEDEIAACYGSGRMWIPVAQQLPEHLTTAAVLRRWLGRPWISVATCINGTWCDGVSQRLDVTHWCPLPTELPAYADEARGPCSWNVPNPPKVEQLWAEFQARAAKVDDRQALYDIPYPVSWLMSQLADLFKKP